MTGNDVTKDERQRKNRENVDRIIGDLNRMFDLTEDRRNVACGMEILNDLLLLDKSFKDDNDDILQPLHLYLAILMKRVRLDLDKTVRNEEVEAYTEFFCEHKEELLEIFTFPRMQKVIVFLISDNLSTHDIEGYERIMSLYSGRISYYYRPILYSRIMNSKCGKLDLAKEIYTLYDRFDVNIVYYADKDTEPILLRNLFALSKELGIEDRAEPVYKFIQGRHPYYVGRIDRDILRYYRTLARYEFQMDYVRRWIESIDEEDVPKELAGQFEELTNKPEKVPDAPFKRWGNPFEDLFRMCTFRNVDRRYPRGALHGEVLSAMDYYARCSHEAKIEDGNRRYKCNSNYYDLKFIERGLKFWADYEKAVTFQNNTDEREGVFFFINEWSLVNASLALPMLMAAEKHGYTYVPTSPRMSVQEELEDPFLDDAAGRLSGGVDRRYTTTPFDRKDYEIDIPNRRIIVQGMNVYQPIYEFVARYQFSYFLNYETDGWARNKVNLLIKIYDRLFDYIREIENWAAENDKKVYFISHAPHIHDAAAFRIYCEEKNERGHLNYVCVSSGYDNYFKNIGDAKTETLTALNLTKNPYSRNSFLGTKEGFERYYEENRHRLADIKSNAMQYLTVHRGVGKKQIDAAEKERILGLIKECKGNGGRVVLLNGKVIFDLAVKYTRGCVHDDMSQWITHAVEFAKKHEDTLLLIKPHPHEKREDLTLTSNKVHTLRSIIRTDLADNTIFLDHDMFTNAELTPFVDIGLVWNGTSSLEFAAQGIPVLVGDVWGHYDYPIGFARPESLAEYESWLQDPGLIREPDDLSDRAVMFLDYMGSEDVRIENRYSKTTTLNFNQYDSTIDMNAVYDYFDHGDEKLDRLFESVL